MNKLVQISLLSLGLMVSGVQTQAGSLGKAAKGFGSFAWNIATSKQAKKGLYCVLAAQSLIPSLFKKDHKTAGKQLGAIALTAFALNQVGMNEISLPAALIVGAVSDMAYQFYENSNIGTLASILNGGHETYSELPFRKTAQYLRNAAKNTASNVYARFASGFSNWLPSSKPE